MSVKGLRERNVVISPTRNFPRQSVSVSREYVHDRPLIVIWFHISLPAAHPPLSLNPPTPLTFFILLSPALFTSLSGVRGMNCAGGFSCVTCWWRRCRDSPDTLCCCGTWQKGVGWTTRPKACRALQSKWTHLYVS